MTEKDTVVMQFITTHVVTWMYYRSHFLLFSYDLKWLILVFGIFHYVFTLIFSFPFILWRDLKVMSHIFLLCDVLNTSCPHFTTTNKYVISIHNTYFFTRTELFNQILYFVSSLHLCDLIFFII